MEFYSKSFEGKERAFVRMPLITNEEELLAEVHGKETLKTVCVDCKGSAFQAKLLQMKARPNSDIPFQYVMEDTLVIITE